MRSRLIATSALVVSVLLALGPVGTLSARAQAPTGPPPAPPTPKAWILVDGDSGAVIGAANDTALVPAASVIKLLTALIAAEHLPPGTPVPVSPRAEGMPARKLNLKAGQT